MRRALTLLELVVAVSAILILVTALTVSTRQGTRRARLSKAAAEMAGIAVEVKAAQNPESAADRYGNGDFCDPWGNPYRVTVKRRSVQASDSVPTASSAVRVPNAYRAGGTEP